MNYHDYIWDLGGTLLDNYEVSTQAFVACLKKYGLSASHDLVYAKLKESTKAAIDYFVPDEDNFLQDYKVIEEQYLRRPILFEGARDILAKIVSEGSRNFLISHRNQQVLTILDKTEIRPYFTEVVTSESGFARKPSPQSLLYLKDKYQIQKAIVIGDRDIDRQAGQAAGFDTLLVEHEKSLMEIIT